METVLRNSQNNFNPNIPAYFERIGYDGNREPTFDNLCAIQAAHLRAVPFEALNIHLGKPIDTDPAQVQTKIVTDKRGGYCFELNNILFYILRAMGYQVMPLMGRVRMNYAPDQPTGKLHLMLRVDIDAKSWLVDVGFGGLSPLKPLELFTDKEQYGTPETRRIVRSVEGGFMHQVKLDGTWNDLQFFTLQETYPIDWKVSNWYTSTYPDMIFSRAVIVSIVRGDERYNLMDKKLTIRKFDGTASEVRELMSHAELIQVLRQYFGLVFPEETVIAAPSLVW